MAAFTARPMMVMMAPLMVASALLVGCDDSKIEEKHISLSISGKKFRLELAIDQPTRVKGLGGRTEIAADGGMMFVFPDAQVAVQGFLMRDCPIAIDIVFLDPRGRIVAFHEMKPEEPRKQGESEAAYENRLKRYSSRFPAQFAIELKGGTIPSLNLKEGQKIEFDAEALKKRAK